ncbi:deoxynucleoside kinase-like isoform X2 [Belonocnema kinseyi]|uniref:deoxynucleoside kinase-like isoform X2 n=2 Tax=Belonocnema kinseyi TaxID=2817044 RepID=UPI00143D1F24|nr:deoxynucleoside kinase-like isoform X2 [Belonocnema kinseyi]
MSPRKLGNRPYTVCIEGNIGSGKTTFLSHFKKCENTIVIEEPVELWRDVSGTNLLELMYKDPSRYACTFQSYVQLTMLQLHTRETSHPYKVMERSIYSVRCFIENMKRMNVLQNVEAYLLEKWYDWALENTKVQADLIVYLRTTPEVVYQRMRTRARKEEDCVSLDYLKLMHQIHDEWLYDRTLFSVPSPVITLDADKNLEEIIEKDIKMLRY